jgi:hypothetical protein
MSTPTCHPAGMTCPSTVWPPLRTSRHSADAAGGDMRKRSSMHDRVKTQLFSTGPSFTSLLEANAFRISAAARRQRLE